MSANSQQLKGRRVCAASVYGFSAGEMRKIAHNVHAKAKEEVASGRARKFQGSIPIRAHLCQVGLVIGPFMSSPSVRRLKGL